ncbi:MAG TPA: gamma-glutamyltransferase, partial [Thermomicrobiales bacterium]|nr:gamma-glutamyltransferase [Thermomicrobiales bacterium]
MPSRSEWVVGRTEARSRGGMVAAKTPVAAEAGATVLANGGNAVDAAVTTALAACVVEPWMNGVGGGGYMVIHQPGEAKATVISYPMISASAATPAMYTMGGADAGFFGWPSVVDNANVMGPMSVGLPGTIAGTALALEKFGTITLAQALAPAIALAEEGFPVTWHTTLKIAQDLALLTKHESTRAIFTNQGNPWKSLDETHPTMLRQPELAATMRQISDQGPRALYEGELAVKIVDALAAAGNPITVADMAAYQASVEEALAVPFHDAVIHAPGFGTGGTTLAEGFLLLGGMDLAAMPYAGADYLHHLAEAFKIAFADRFAYLADPEKMEVPLERLLSAGYLDARRNEIDPLKATPARAGVRAALGVGHKLEASVPDYTSDGSTTHHSVIDRNGMAVATTQTLLSLWGSGFTVPGTGILMNNGMMWFDPQAGRPNSVGGSKKPLCNMAPTLVTRENTAFAALGASGGRRIMNCVAQMA